MIHVKAGLNKMAAELLVWVFAANKMQIVSKSVASVFRVKINIFVALFIFIAPFDPNGLNMDGCWFIRFCFLVKVHIIYK